MNPGRMRGALPAEPGERATHQAATAAKLSPLAVWLVAALSLSPFLLGLHRLQHLFYFGDEWDLLSELDKLGLARWSLQPFAESFVPVFKLLWGGAVLLSHGSYLCLLTLLWLTHFLTVATFGFILRRLGFGAFAIALAMLTPALAWTNIESLGWTAQWAPGLSLLLFLLACLCLLDILQPADSGRPSRAKLAIYGILLVASALSFSRGVFGGVVLGCYLIVGRRAAVPPAFHRALLAVSFAVPLAFAAFVYLPGVLTAPGLPSPAEGKVAAMLAFGAHALLLNPLLHLACWDATRLGPAPLVVFGLCKLGTMAAGFFVLRSSRRQTAFLAALVVLDVLNACVLGFARYHTGLTASVSSRYQYLPLLCLGPFLGVVAQRALAVAHRWIPARAAAGCLLAGWCLALTHGWPAEINNWSNWRGAEARAALARRTVQAPFARSLINSERALRLQAKYNLH